MSTIAGRWDDYSLGVALDRHDSARYDAQARTEEIDEEIKRLRAEQDRLGEVANRHYNAAMRLARARSNLRKRVA
ncbi:MAG: hypothetical protein WC969_14865 [Elusimicrobiota bacterium]|jgi:predicted nuclease with TOPRIM domain